MDVKKSTGSRWHISILTLMSGASLAAAPTAILAIASHNFTVAEQALLVIAVAVGTLLSQLVSSMTVESELASEITAAEISNPRWLVILGVLASLFMIVFPSNAVVICLLVAPMFSALEVGRVVSVASQRDRTELQSSLTFAILIIAAVTLSVLGFKWSLSLIGFGSALVIIWRAIPTWRSARRMIKHSVRAWLGFDSITAGITFPVITAITLLTVGADLTAALGMVASVSAVAALPASYLKMRLLAQHSSREIWLASIAALLASSILIILQISGLLNVIFGPSWTKEVTIWVITVACLWRMSSLFSVIPFAELRRKGRIRRMFLVRICASLLTIWAVWAISGLGLIAILVALTFTEIATGLGYFFVKREKSLSTLSTKSPN